MRSLGLLAVVLVMGTATGAYAQVINPLTQPAPAVGAPKEWPANQAVVAKPAAEQAPQPVAPTLQTAPALQPATAQSPYPTSAIDSVGGGAIPALPLEIMTSGGVVYVSGGIGDEEVDMLKARESEFNVRVLISAGKGEYVSGIGLRFLDSKETPLVQINDAGPYVYAKMQPGSYILETAASNGEHKKSNFTVTGKGTTRLNVLISE